MGASFVQYLTSNAGTGNLGHRIKALWFTDQVARPAGDTGLSRFAQDAAQRVFDLAWNPAAGGWFTGLDATGQAYDLADWRSFAEMNQYAAALAIDMPMIRDRQAQDY